MVMEASTIHIATVLGNIMASAGGMKIVVGIQHHSGLRLMVSGITSLLMDTWTTASIVKAAG